jgi:UDP-N-acetylglucosamine 4,6-dehydratase
MQQNFKDNRLRFFYGDITKIDRLELAFRGVDIIIHTAALKHVDLCERNPYQAVETNILGSWNVCATALCMYVKKVLAISSDKAVHPVNIYGKTKGAMESLFADAGVYGDTKFAVVRFGNFEGSSGSFLEFLYNHKSGEKIQITDKDMVRWWITLDEAAAFTIQCLKMMKGGEIFVPKMKSAYLIDVAYWTVPKAVREFTGIRQGEKLHECLITVEESKLMKEYPEMWVIHIPEKGVYKADLVWAYYSNSNSEWWREPDMEGYIQKYKKETGYEEK